MIHLSTLRLGNLAEYDWAAYFEENHQCRLQIDFSEEEELTEEEKKLIFPSIRMFHAGEASDGRFLLDTVKAYTQKNGNEAYLKAMEWFVKEENWHSAYLKKYMDFHGIEPAKKIWLDQWFRRLRKLGGLKCEVIVLVTAEMIALSYYSALAQCTESKALKSICGQMLHDELRHIVFQSYTLHQLKTTRFQNLLRIILMEVTMSLVWLSMKDVFVTGGYSFRRFAGECLGYLKQSIKISKTGGK